MIAGNGQSIAENGTGCAEEVLQIYLTLFNKAFGKAGAIQ
jgi:hypothetical protein